MNHKHRATLHAIFAHPISSNIDLKMVTAVLEDLGAETAHGGHGRLTIKLNGRAFGMHDSRHDLSKDEVAALRKFLSDAGVDPAKDYPL